MGGHFTKCILHFVKLLRELERISGIDSNSILEEWGEKFVPKILTQTEMECSIRPSLATIFDEIVSCSVHNYI